MMSALQRFVTTALRRLTTPPPFDDDDTARAARILYAILVSIMALFVLATIVGMAFIYEAKLGSAVTLLAFGAVLTAVRILAGKRHIRAASFILVSGAWITFGALIALSGGARSVNLIYWVAITVFAGVLLGRPIAILVAVLSSVATLVLVGLEWLGIPLPRMFPVPAVAGWLDLTLCLYFVITPLGLALKGLADALEKARKELKDRLRAEEEQRRLEAQLRQAQKLESVGRLAGGIAHDFNNLLTGILGHLSLVIPTLDLADTRRAWLLSAKNAAHGAAELTRQLLAFSRQQVIEPKNISLNEVVQAMRELLKRTLGEDVELTTRLSDALGSVNADPSQLESVLVNLALNARDAMPAGGKLTIETANVELDSAYCGRARDLRPGSYVMLAVSDNGCGIDADTQQHIFDPFFTTKPKGQGTGLGLSMVFGTVKQHGGHIAVYSELGRGTTFKIYLPRVSGPAEALDKATTTPLDLPKGSEVVAIVEDEEVVREIIHTVLLRLGYETLPFDSAEKATTALAERALPIHLLLTDVVLRGANGRDLANALQARWPTLKVLYISGYTQNIVTHHGILEPGIEFLGKPFTPADLAKKVRTLLDSTR